MFNKYSGQFIEEATEVLNIYYSIFSECRIYQNNEREIVHAFDDRKYSTENDSLLQKKIRKLKIRYLLKHSSISKGNELHREIMTKLDELKQELLAVARDDDE